MVGGRESCCEAPIQDPTAELCKHIDHLPSPTEVCYDRFLKTAWVGRTPYHLPITSADMCSGCCSVICPYALVSTSIIARFCEALVQVPFTWRH